MITKLVLFLCLFCPVPDKERAILEDALSRCSSLERIGEIMDIVERHHLEYRIPVHPPVHRFHRISSAYGWRSDPVTGQRRFHSGVDIAAELASTVHAAADGKVIILRKKWRIWILCDDTPCLWFCDPVRALVRLLCSGRGRGQEWQSDRIHRIKRKKHGKPSAL